MLAVSDGFQYTWSPDKPLGDRVDPADIQLNGAVVGADDEVRVTVNSFLAGGGDGFDVLAEGTDRKAGTGDLDALLVWLEAHPGAKPGTGTRVQTR